MIVKFVVGIDTEIQISSSNDEYVILESRCPEVLARLLDDAGIWNSIVHAKKVQETEDNTCITQNTLLTQEDPVETTEYMFKQGLLTLPDAKPVNKADDVSFDPESIAQILALVKSAGSCY
ncbi:hypothetical protein llap_7135 [Limosa lapponica baueri]|uniref:Uncharacterized protein n=1 Tax=Limosa lapponica baueri TaxID=1758121 RepID=A0A2I0U943_LIMLA|nr:hypothetical protein llap_7135 [Limosa lapponica baueri]